jgi:hypothetical protein
MPPLSYVFWFFGLLTAFFVSIPLTLGFSVIVAHALFLFIGAVLCIGGMIRFALIDIEKYWPALIVAACVTVSVLMSVSLWHRFSSFAGSFWVGRAILFAWPMIIGTAALAVANSYSGDGSGLLKSGYVIALLLVFVVVSVDVANHLFGFKIGMTQRNFESNSLPNRDFHVLNALTSLAAVFGLLMIAVAVLEFRDAIGEEFWIYFALFGFLGLLALPRTISLAYHVLQVLGVPQTNYSLALLSFYDRNAFLDLVIRPLTALLAGMAVLRLSGEAQIKYVR